MSGISKFFPGFDFAQLATNLAQIATASCLLISVLSILIFWNVFIGTYTLGVGVIISVWELNFLYAPLAFCVNAEELKKKAIDMFYLSHLQSRSLIYMLFSIPMILVTSINVLPGVLLFFSGVFNLIAGICSDASESSAEENMSNGMDERAPFATKNMFGTF